jgi:hypothetical protein
MNRGRNATRLLPLALLACAVSLLTAPAGAGAVATIGQTFTPTTQCLPNQTLLQSGSPGFQYVVPAAGVITSFSFQGPATMVPQLRFKTARRLGGDVFLITGQSDLGSPTANSLSTFPVQLPVAAGDLIGYYLPPGSNKLCAKVIAGYTLHKLFEDPQPGSTPTFLVEPQAAQIDLSATLETTPCKGKPPTIAGSTGADQLTGTPGADVIVGLNGNDKISGLAGNDVACGGNGKDTLKGGKGKDVLLGQNGKDTLKGGGGKDTCTGAKGIDSAAGCETEKSI